MKEFENVVVETDLLIVGLPTDATKESSDPPNQTRVPAKGLFGHSFSQACIDPSALGAIVDSEHAANPPPTSRPNRHTWAPGVT